LTVFLLPFRKPYLLTKGGPNGETMTIGLMIYNSGFNNYNFGEASAKAMVLLVIVGIVAYVQMKAMSADVES